MRNSLRSFVGPVFVFALLLGNTGHVHAYQIDTAYVDENHCDTLANRNFPEELGLPPDVWGGGGFPEDEWMGGMSTAVKYGTCGFPEHARLIEVTNLTLITYEDFFVANQDYSFLNHDGTVHEVADGSEHGQAMRIDGTIAAGINNPLIYGSIYVDEIF